MVSRTSGDHGAFLCFDSFCLTHLLNQACSTSNLARLLGLVAWLGDHERDTPGTIGSAPSILRYRLLL